MLVYPTSLRAGVSPVLPSHPLTQSLRRVLLFIHIFEEVRFAEPNTFRAEWSRQIFTLMVEAEPVFTIQNEHAELAIIRKSEAKTIN